MKKLFLIACMLVNSALMAVVHAKDTALEYIENFKDLAVDAMHQTKIPASVILAIAMMESANGNSRVCRILNNHFGIKGRNSGKIGSSYKEYATDEASFHDFIRVISGKRFYSSSIFVTDVRHWVTSIAKTGYSEAPTAWTGKIFKTIKQYNLAAYDRM